MAGGGEAGSQQVDVGVERRHHHDLAGPHAGSHEPGNLRGHRRDFLCRLLAIALVGDGQIAEAAAERRGATAGGGVGVEAALVERVRDEAADVGMQVTNDRDAYVTALRAVKTTRNLDAWLTYYTGGLAEEFERVADRVSALNLQAGRLPAVQLTPHQEKAVAELTTGARAFITRAEFEDLTGLRKTQAAAELGALVEAGVFRSVGQGFGRRYELAGRSSSAGRRGPAPHWTEERVRAELQALTAEFGRFPTPVEFRSDGKWGLYLAASRLGGIRRWRSEIGVSRD